MATNTPSINHTPNDAMAIQMVHDALSFDGHQELRLKEIEKRIEDEMKKKKKDWEKEVQRMRDEFLRLYPSDRNWGSEELINDPLISKRRGSTDVLDRRKMKTLFQDLPDAGRRFKLRFNCIGFDPKDVTVTAEGDRVVVRAVKMEEDTKGNMVEMEYNRKIEKPKEVDISKVKSFLTCDGILIVEASLPPHSLNLRKLSHSPSHSSQGSRASSRSRSPSSSPRTPVAQKPGLAIFIDADNGMRRMSLIVEIGIFFKPKDITVSIVKDNRIMVKAKHEERTSDRLSKNKFSKEFDLSEKIDPFTLRGGLTISEGKLLVGAISKGHRGSMSVEEAGEWLSEEMGINNKKMHHCNVIDLACFPPAAVMTSSMTSSMSS